MAVIIDTSTMQPEDLSKAANLWVYNGLDCCVTVEAFQEIQLSNDPKYFSIPYHFSRAMQAPALEMMLRGFRVDQNKRAQAIHDLNLKQEFLHSLIQRYAQVVWGQPLNPLSPDQLKLFFYKHMGLPEVILSFKGEKKISVNREALEKLQVYFHARPICLALLAYRDVRKKLGVLKSGIDSDGRMRTSYNVVGTDTGRWSSSSNIFGGGDNLQNVTEELRDVFCASKGRKLCYADLEQAESKVVALLAWLVSGDDSYLRACESGDLHTYVARLVWPDLPWNGDLKKDKLIAEQPFYRHFSYRDMAKRGGHGTNYYGQPWNMARQIKVDVKLMELFQERYFFEFPCIPAWHKHTARQLQLEGSITTLLGMHRTFFGRLNDDATLRKAIAHEPQSIIGQLLNRGVYKIWSTLRDQAYLLAQVHDAVIAEYPEADEPTIAPKIRGCLILPMTIQDRHFEIGAELSTGWNWGKMVTQADIDKDVAAGRKPKRLNLAGLKKWAGKDERKWNASGEAFAILGQRISGVHGGTAHPGHL